MARATVRRRIGLLLVLAACVLGVTVPAHAGPAVGSTATEATVAGGFIARTLTAAGGVYQYAGGYGPDLGNTIDAMIALDAAGVGSAESATAYQGLVTNLADAGGTGSTYISWGDNVYAGSTAKALLGVVIHGGDPTAVSGWNLITQLQAMEGLVTPGRFSDKSTDGSDYSITIHQALAIIALQRSGQTVSSAAVDFLALQQCADGGFRDNELATPGSFSDPTATCVSTIDTTGFAVQALIAAGADVNGASVQAAVAYLVGKQAADGSVGGNANSTALATQAFLAAGDSTHAELGRAFLLTLQYGCAAAADLRGGIAYDAATVSSGAPADSDIRATPQSTLALAGYSLVNASSAAGSTEVGTLTCETSTPTPTAPTTTEPTTTTPATTAPATTGPATSTPATAVPTDTAATSATTATDAGATSATGAAGSTSGAGNGGRAPGNGGGSSLALANTGAEPGVGVALIVLMLTAGGGFLAARKRR